MELTMEQAIFLGKFVESVEALMDKLTEEEVFCEEYDQVNEALVNLKDQIRTVF